MTSPFLDFEELTEERKSFSFIGGSFQGRVSSPPAPNFCISYACEPMFGLLFQILGP